MGSLFRSEEMVLCQLFLQSEAAYACVSELGELGLVQFRDLNPDVNAFQRKFVNEVRRCDEMERKLRFLEKEIRKDDIPMLDTGENPDAPQPREMIDLEATFEKLENEMKEVNTNAEALKKNFLELTELKHILRKTQLFFEESERNVVEDAQTALASDPADSAALAAAAGSPLRLGFVAGVILRERLPAFERMLWRACRGNVFLRTAEIDTPLEDPVTGDSVHKSVFIIFFQGDQLKTRVKKICEGFRATLYPCPETPAERREIAVGVMTRIEDLNNVLGQTQEHRHRVLLAAAKNIKVWFIKVKKIKAIYHTLNLFNLDVTHKCLIAECWAAVSDLEQVQLALRRGTESSGSSVPSILNRMPTKQTPPTFHRTNRVTQAFQEIVDAYGVATYREVNPAPFSIITFPFLFSVMFGDAGHGVIMFLFALFMVLRENQFLAKKSDNEIWNIFFGGRYVILLMGMFSVYSGMLYNDIFSKSVNIFGTSWIVGSDPAYSDKVLAESEQIMLDPRNTYNNTGYPYPFGLDPVWQMAENKIVYHDSLKMKMSVIFGVSQMLFGTSLSLFNYRYFNNRLNIFCQFIPEVVFISCTFGYLVILIFAKWLSNYFYENSNEAPSLLIGLINMFLFKYDDAQPKSAQTWFGGQQALQMIFVLVALGCVPVMLIVKPYILYKKNQARKNQISGAMVNDENAEVVHHDQLQAAEADEEEEFDLGDMAVKQAIHTIEYCLGTISHTASYLRLWALSLAHAQLSEVLWTMVLKIGLNWKGWVGGPILAVIFCFWAVVTVAVLLLMEGLSAFLHALRLHWVEFQSKFYKGEGYKFQPFAFSQIIDLQTPGGQDIQER